MFCSRLDFINYSFVLFLFFPLSNYGWFEHDRAIIAGKHQEWDEAARLLEKLAINKPDNSDVIYDAGVAAYKTGNFKHAQNYFDVAAQASKNNPDKAKSYFNMGNSYAHELKFQQAIESYEKALALDADNQNIRENLDLVKKMLEQKKKNEKEDQNDRKKEEEKEEDKQQDQQQEKNSQEGPSEHDQKNDHEKENDESRENNNEKKPERDDEQKKNESSNKKNSGNSKKNKTEETGDQTQNNESSDDASEQKKEYKTQLDAHLAKVLEEQEKRDAQSNKQMIKSTVGKQMVSNHGQNCW